MFDVISGFNKLVAEIEIQGFRRGLEKVRDLSVETIFGSQRENPINSVIRRLAKSRSYQTYIDVGAYIGDTTIPISRLFHYCIAIEPTQASFEALRVNLRRMNVTNCKAINCALGDKEMDVAELHQVGDRPDNNSILAPAIQTSSQKVRMYTLDTLLNTLDSPLEPPFLLKLDVEGYELHVAKGAERIIRSDCTIVSEFWPYALRRGGGGGDAYLSFMRKRGFETLNLKLGVIDSVKLGAYCKRYEDSPGVSTNIVFDRIMSSS